MRIPSAWKSGVVSPRPKKGDPTNPNNIRPITQTHICGKLLEKVINARLTDYFESNNLFYPGQMGFRKGFSTKLAITKLVSDINLSLNNNEYVGCIYIDMCKAFDCIRPDLLLNKLKFYGLCPVTISWLQNYFSGRSQAVRVTNHLSTSLPITYGVPQG